MAMLHNLAIPLLTELEMNSIPRLCAGCPARPLRTRSNFSGSPDQGQHLPHSTMQQPCAGAGPVATPERSCERQDRPGADGADSSRRRYWIAPPSSATITAGPPIFLLYCSSADHLPATWGTGALTVALGWHGALLAARERVLRPLGPRVRTRSTVGAADSALAGFPAPADTSQGMT